ncbi:hypothetical protein TNCV_3846821 [Trichonephila clavipes]|nr:hypothetical protein TNCV_3846821 [Trichonephila clavipes]
MDFSSSDSEGENMDTRTDQRRRTPSPPVIPPDIRVIEENLQHIENASNCGDFLAEMFQLMDNLDRYSFRCEDDKSTYHSKLISPENQPVPTPGNPLQTHPRKKNNRKSPSPPPETASKKLKTTEVETANRFSNLQIEDPPNLENEQDERDEDVPQPKPPRFRPPPPITIDNVNNSAAFLKQLQNMTQENLMGRIIGKGLRVYPKTPQAYHKIRSFIDHEKLESYNYQLNEEKKN